MLPISIQALADGIVLLLMFLIIIMPIHVLCYIVTCGKCILIYLKWLFFIKIHSNFEQLPHHNYHIEPTCTCFYVIIYTLTTVNTHRKAVILGVACMLPQTNSFPSSQEADFPMKILYFIYLKVKCKSIFNLMNFEHRCYSSSSKNAYLIK